MKTSSNVGVLIVRLLMCSADRPSARFLQDVRTIAGRALRQIPREPAAVIPPVFVPAFFYAVNLGALEKLAGTTLDYKAFLLPMAIAFAVTAMSRAPALVTDIHGGYFDRLCMTPIRRSSLSCSA